MSEPDLFKEYCRRTPQELAGQLIEVEETKAKLRADLAAARARIAELESKLNTPQVDQFLPAVALEAAHQRSRWGTDHDAGKTDADWYWLVGHLAGKALHKPEKRLHHIITTAAALFNWHLYSIGETNMRPGIEDPDRARSKPEGTDT